MNETAGYFCKWRRGWLAARTNPPLPRNKPASSLSTQPAPEGYGKLTMNFEGPCQCFGPFGSQTS
jgi:hypothetical protein